MSTSNKSLKTVYNLANLKTYQVGVIESAAHRALRQHKDGLLKGYGITGIEWYLIGTVADTGRNGARITDLAKTLGTTQGFLTKTVNLLEAKGILIRKANARDARSNFVVVNENYRQTLSEIEAALRHKLRESIYSQISADELVIYINILNKFKALE